MPHDVEIALVDVRMPDSDGLELLHELKTRWPDVPVIMLTSFDHAHYVRRALAEGAAGYMLKDATPRTSSRRSRSRSRGRQRPVAEGDPEPVRGDGGRPIGSEGRGCSSRRGAPRETDILALLAEGKSNRDISRALYLSEKTVKAHLAAIFRKLGVTNRTQAAMAAVSMGIGPDLRMVDTGTRGSAAGASDE